MYRFFFTLSLLSTLANSALINKTLDLPKFTTAGISSQTDRCDATGDWQAYAFLAEDCFAAIQKMYIHDVLRHPDETFEFMAMGTRAKTAHPRVRTPAIYTINSCTLAIVTLDYFKLTTLPGGTSFRFPTSDIATFTSIWKAARTVEKDCLLPSRRPGWQPVGTKGGIGVFLWATKSVINQQVTGLNAQKSLKLMNASDDGVADS